MKKYNDYVEAILRYLRRLNELRAYHKNLQDEIAAKEEMLRTVSAPIARYSLAPSGGGNGGSRVEGDCERRAAMEEELQSLRLNSSTLAVNLAKIGRALGGLDSESRSVIEMRWVDGCKWEYIALSLHLSPRNCRDKSHAALDKMALMMFGPGALPEQLSFVFFGDRIVHKLVDK